MCSDVVDIMLTEFVTGRERVAKMLRMQDDKGQQLERTQKMWRGRGRRGGREMDGLNGHLKTYEEKEQPQ